MLAVGVADTVGRDSRSEFTPRGVSTAPVVPAGSSRPPGSKAARVRQRNPDASPCLGSCSPPPDGKRPTFGSSPAPSSPWARPPRTCCRRQAQARSRQGAARDGSSGLRVHPGFRLTFECAPPADAHGWNLKRRRTEGSNDDQTWGKSTTARAPGFFHENVAAPAWACRITSEGDVLATLQAAWRTCGPPFADPARPGEAVRRNRAAHGGQRTFGPAPFTGQPSDPPPRLL